jgi:hypothetical protein
MVGLGLLFSTHGVCGVCVFGLTIWIILYMWGQKMGRLSLFSPGLDWSELDWN